MNWSETNILIIGAARQGLALTRFLIKQGAHVTINDNRPAEKLTVEMDSFAGEPVKWVLGDHPLSLLDGKDLIAVSGGVPLEIPLLIEANKRGIPLTNDSQIFMDQVPCPVIGITGSAGKTTTTTLVGKIAEATETPNRKAWVGGNIGLPLIDLLDQIKAEDRVILELSSFQLELMQTAPSVAAVTNITPNHLDRHGTLEAYTAAKANILNYQNKSDFAVLNREDPGAWNLRKSVKGQLISFGKLPLPENQNGTFMDGDNLVLQINGKQTVVCKRSDIHLRGEHNLYNVLSAIAIASAAGFPASAIKTAIQNFTGVKHRLEFVRKWSGADFYNDSIATAPERTMAALEVFDEPILLLLGGKDKNLPWDKLAKLVHQKVDHVVIFGHAAQKIHNALTAETNTELPLSITVCGPMEEALNAAKKLVKPGQIVLLSPGGTSYDEFKDFAERGERFIKWVHQLP